MRRTQQRLSIWMNRIRAGFWEKARGEDLLQYLPEWIVDEQGRPLSLSLPFIPGNQRWRGNIVGDCFNNLLPDSESIRRRLAVRYKAKSLEPYDLLAELGRDCIGTIQLLNADEEPTDLFSVNYRPLSDADIATILRNTTTASLLVGRMKVTIYVYPLPVHRKKRLYCGMKNNGVYQKVLPRRRIFSSYRLG